MFTLKVRSAKPGMRTRIFSTARTRRSAPTGSRRLRLAWTGVAALLALALPAGAAFWQKTPVSAARASNPQSAESSLLAKGQSLISQEPVPISVAATGDVDPCFNPSVFDTPAAAFVSSLARQSDGRIIVFGSFSSINGTARDGIARLNADGSLDTSFSPSPQANGAIGQVQAVAVQSDGKILIGGTFTSVNGTARNNIARLNADGSLDTSFNPGSGTDKQVRAITLQSDGKILIGGSFTSVNGTARNRIARLNADGSLDTSFNPGSGTDKQLRAITLQSDGKILIGGSFTSVNGTARNRIARLHADGSLDTSFNPGSGASGTFDFMQSIAQQVDGKIVIGGQFNSFNGMAIKNVARLNADGSLDPSFNPGTGPNFLVNAVAVQLDGKIVIGGGFSNVNGTARQGIARLNADGSLDTSFNPGSGTDFNSVSVLALQTDGKIVIGGLFASVNGTAHESIARLNTNGSLDTSFNTQATRGGGAGGAFGIAVQP